MRDDDDPVGAGHTTTDDGYAAAFDLALMGVSVPVERFTRGQMKRWMR